MAVLFEDVIWRAGQTIRLTEDLEIAPGATLTIEPGAIVDGGGHSLTIFGQLDADGTAAVPILFDGLRLDFGPSALSAYDTAIRLDHVTMNGGAFLASNDVRGQVYASNSVFLGVEGFNHGDQLYSSFDRNIFARSAGLNITAYGHANVTNNTFIGQTSPAISFRSDFAVPLSELTGNNFLSTDRVAIEAGVNSYFTRLNANGNYFGTVSAATIAANILDRNDSLLRGGTIAVDNPLAGPSVSAPTATLGGAGAENYAGSSAHDFFTGGAGDDAAAGGAGADTLLGDAGNDRLDGGAGADMLQGGDGDDRLTPGLGRDWIDGGAGEDTLVLSGALGDYTPVRAGDGWALNVAAGTDRVRNVERVEIGGQTLAWSDFTTQAFDGLRYIAGYADLIAALGPNAEAGRAHFAALGMAEGRDPIRFDAYAYAASNPDLARAFGTDAAAIQRHYISVGAGEGRSLTGFDPLVYAALNPDLARALGDDGDALTQHYLVFGANEGRTTAGFDPLIYAASNPQLIDTVGLDPQQLTRHFVTAGRDEGLSADSFDPLLYGASNADLARVYGDDARSLVLHYLRSGYGEERATTGFDPLAYAASHPDLAGVFATGRQALTLHYLRFGADEGRAPDLFNAFVYGASNPAVAAAVGIDAEALALHYLTIGRAAGLATASFDPIAYAAANPDVALALGADRSALGAHYLNFGIAEGRPVSGFDPLLYAASNPDVYQAIGADPAALTLHFVTQGLPAGLAADSFSPLRYSASNLDLAQLFGTDRAALIDHYLTFGINEGRSTDSFDPLAYIATYPDLISAYGADAEAGLRHYLAFGLAENRAPGSFDALSYGASNPDLAVAFGPNENLLTAHFIDFGFAEGRSPGRINTFTPVGDFGASLQGSRVIPAGEAYVRFTDRVSDPYYFSSISALYGDDIFSNPVNRGVVWLDVPSNNVTAVSAYNLSTFTNDGMLLVRTAGTATGFYSGSWGRMVNNGVVYVEADGNATGYLTWDPGGPAWANLVPDSRNFGLIEVHSRNGEALGMSVVNGMGVINGPGAVLFVKGQSATGITQGGHGGFVLNQGEVTAISHGDTPSVGIRGNFSENVPGEAATLVNDGLIDADIAIKAEYYFSPSSGTVDSVLNRGEVVGAIELGDGNDRLINIGRIAGDIALGFGDDGVEWDLAGTIEGLIDGGPGTDMLRLIDDAGQLLRLTAIDDTATLRNIERIELAGVGATTLRLGAADLAAATDANRLLTIDGAPGDAVQLDGAWTAQPDVLLNGLLYHSYVSATSVLQVDAEVLVIL